MTDTVTDRFLRYAVIDTQSDPRSASQPSTGKQKTLARLLVEELLAIGLEDAHLDEHGYVYATIPATVDKPVPVICFCSHMDTAPDFTGTGVKPQLLRNYQGGDIVLPGDTSQVICVAENRALADQIGNDIVTTDGTTLLGADDKAGLAEIVTAAARLMADPSIPHGVIKLLFTPDEEIGRGVDKVDLARPPAIWRTRPFRPMASRSRSRASPFIRVSPRGAWKTPSASPARSSPACRTGLRRKPPPAAPVSSIRPIFPVRWKRRGSA